VPCTLCAFFIHDQDADELVAKYVIGSDADALTDIRIPVGQRLSGWVAANRQTILNSDPALDFIDKSTSIRLKLNSCLSTPLLFADKLIGVLSLYSVEVNGFSEEHRRIVEVLSPQFALTLKRASEFDGELRTDPVTGLPGIKQLEQLIGTDADDPELRTTNFCLVFVDLINLGELSVLDPTVARNEVIRHAAIRIQSSLRFADILFRVAGNRFVAFLHRTDSDNGESVAESVCERIKRSPVPLSGGGCFGLDVRTTCVTAGGDRSSFETFQATAALDLRGSCPQQADRTVLH